MKSSQVVVPLVPIPRPFNDALYAFAAGRNVDCLSALHHHTSLEAAFLRVRALIRLGRLPDAEATIRSTYGQCEKQGDFAQHYMLLGTVLDRKGGYDGADVAFFNARAFAWSVPSVALHTELAYYEALSAWRRHDLACVEQLVIDALNKTAKSWDEPHLYPVELSQAFLYELLALRQGARGEHDAQLTCLKIALQTLSPAAHRQAWAEAHILSNLSSLVPELPTMIRRVCCVLVLSHLHGQPKQSSKDTTSTTH